MPLPCACSAFRKAECLEGVLAPGETLYYPEDYWHQVSSGSGGSGSSSSSSSSSGNACPERPPPPPPQTQSLDEGAAAISGTIVTPSNGGLVAAELRSECNGANRCATVGFGGGRGAGGGGIE